MSRIYRINFYPTDWLVHTAHMTPEERGVFITICALIYANRGAIENDAHRIGRASNCSPRKARAVINSLIARGDLQQVHDTFITQKRCESELNFSRKLSENGAKGGRKSSEKEPESRENKDIEESPPPPEVPSLNNNNNSNSNIVLDTGVSNIDIVGNGFEEFWLAWRPIRGGSSKKQALVAYERATKRRISHETIIRGVGKYIDYIRASGSLAKHAATWLNNDGWADEYDASTCARRSSSAHERRYEAARDLLEGDAGCGRGELDGF